MRVLIADDHDLLRDTLQNYLEAEQGIAVTAVADLTAAIAEVDGAPQFDLIVLDVAMPGMNGFAGFDKMRVAAASTPVALMSGSAPQAMARQALERGAAGFLPKTLPAKSLANAMRMMADGDRYIPADIAIQSAGNPPEEGSLEASLSPRERQVLTGLCEGKSNKEIARDLDLREPTIKLHVKTICRKLDARNRTHAAIIAKQSGFC